MDIYDLLLKDVPIPRFVCARYQVKAGDIRREDIPLLVRERIARRGVLKPIRPGDTVAVAAGSRGIHNYDAVVRAVVVELIAAGARPFIIPAMGSHGGATAEGQREVLAGYGIIEETMGVPVVSCMETTRIGTTADGIPVHIDSCAAKADWIVPVNRIKPHTDFRGPHESGLMKMLAIGCGKQFGANLCHTRGFGEMARNVTGIASTILDTGRVLFGLAVIEDALDGTYKLEAIPGERIPDEEEALLLEAKALIPGLPFEKVDALILTEIGKEISGSGMDSNVTGRSSNLGTWKPFVDRIAVLDLTELSHHNGVGMGLADVTTKRFFDKFRFEATYPNGITSHDLSSLKLPPVMPSDLAAIRMMLHSLPDVERPNGPRVVWMRNTLCIQSFLISESLAEEASAIPGMSVGESIGDIPFDEAGNIRFGDLEDCFC